MTLKTELEFRIKLASNKLISLWENNHFKYSSENNTQNIFSNLKCLYALLISDSLFKLNTEKINNIFNYYNQFITIKENEMFLIINDKNNHNWNAVMMLIYQQMNLPEVISIKTHLINQVNKNDTFPDFYPIYALLLNGFYDENVFNKVRWTNLYSFYETFCIYKYTKKNKQEIDNFRAFELKSTTSLFASQYQRSLLLNGFNDENITVLDYQIGTQIIQGENAGLFAKRKNSKEIRIDYTSESLHSMIEIHNII